MGNVKYVGETNQAKSEEPSSLKPKGIIFARVSTDRQEKEGLSLEDIQLPKMREYAKEKGIDIVAEYAIGETGGGYKKRKKFDEMVAFLKKHKEVSEIIAFRVDRITRNFRDAVVMDELRLNYEKRIHCIDERIILHKDSRAIELSTWNFKVLFAQEYLNRVRDDGNETKKTKLNQGELPWGAPYGYAFETISERPRIKTVAPKEPEATIVKEIHSLYSTGTYSCSSLAKAINKKHHTRFVKSRIHEILTDRFYIGYILDKKTGTLYPHIYDTIIDEDVFERNQDVLLGHSNRRRRYGGIPSAYRGLITCADCGCTITPEFKTKKQKNGNVHHYRYYHCSNGKGAHKTLVNMPESLIDERIKEVLRSLHIPRERVEKLKEEIDIAHKAKNAFYEAQANDISAKRKLLSNRRQRAYDMLMDGSITPEQYNENNKRYEEELAQLQRRAKRLENAEEQFYRTVGYLIALFSNAERIFDVADEDEKRQIVSLLLSNLQLRGKELTFTLKKPFDELFSTSNVRDGGGWEIRTPAPGHPSLTI